MKVGDKEIKTGLEVTRGDRRAVSTIAKIEDRIKKMLLEKFGYILSPYEIKQITRREKERGERKEESLARSQWNIMRSKERGKLMEKIRRDIQEGKLFKKHKKKASKPEEEEKKSEHKFNNTVLKY